MGCCKATTKWKIEETKWRIALEGIDAGGILLAASMERPGHSKFEYALQGGGTDAAFTKKTEKIQNTSIIRKVISGPDGNNCPNINGGKMVGSPSKQDESRTPSKISIFPVRVPIGGSTYWKWIGRDGSGVPNNINGLGESNWYGGYQEFKPIVVIYEEIWHEDWEAENNAGKKDDCCKKNVNVQNLYDKKAEWVSKLGNM